MEIPPEIEDISRRLRQQHGIVRAVDRSFYVKALQEAIEYKGCFLSYWDWMGMKTFVIYRRDRLPQPEEFLGFLQTLFDDGTISELVTTKFSRHFIQGEPLFIVDSISEKMGAALADYADVKDEVEQFDLENTTTGKRMMERLINGRS